MAAAAHIRRARQRDAAGLQVVIRLAEEAAAMGHEAASAVIVAGVAVAHAAAALACSVRPKQKFLSL